MSDILGHVVASVIIGAIIGGGTNRLAIVMLFRPHRPLRIGAWSVPFTPGLIPKRRHELAIQLGRTVREYLINGEAIRRTMLDPDIEERIVIWLRERLSDASLARVVASLTDIVAKGDALSGLRIKNVIPQEMKHHIISYVKTWTPELNQALVRFLQSQRGEVVLRKLYGEWIQSQGWVGRLTSSLIVEEAIVEKTRNWLVRTLQSPHGYDAVRTVIDYGIETVFDLQLSHIVTSFEQRGESIKMMNVCGGKLIERVVPKVLQVLASLGDHWLDLLRLDRLVTEQIETFSLQKLEDMIVKVAKKELRLITWIGAFIGALIGLCQGLLVTMLG